MNDLFTFDEAPWEQALERLQPGDSFPAVQLLTLLEGADESALEDALQAMEDGGVTLDLSGLPKNHGTGEAALRLRQEEQLIAEDKLLTGLEETDPLRLYLEELARVPVCGDVAVLAMDAAADENARDLLANLMLSRVLERAKEYVGYGVLLMDLIQEGGMGMWQGILNWNGDGDFETHADWWIRQYMAKAVTSQARAVGTGRMAREAMEDYRAVDERLLGELGRNPTVEEMAQELHRTVEETLDLQQMILAARKLAQLRPGEKAEEEPEEEAEQAVENTAYFQTRQRIEQLLSSLTEEDARVLKLRFGLEGELPMTPEQTASRLGLTPEEILRREAAALQQLRREN